MQVKLTVSGLCSMLLAPQQLGMIVSNALHECNSSHIQRLGAWPSSPEFVLRVAVASGAASDRIFARYLEWIQDCKEAIHTLRMCVKSARAHRSRCCALLGAALGASLALEQAVYSGTLQISKAQELQRLCASVTAAIELAQQRVQVSACAIHVALPVCTTT